LKLILTIDTEGDNQWDHGRKLSVENIKFIPRFQELCDKYQIRPTYLVTNEVCTDTFARKIFREFLLAGRVEVGAHLHSWTTPPFQDRDGFRHNDRNHAFAHELPDELIFEKIKNLTEIIGDSFGTKARSFRSGRYGFNQTVAGILAENEYLVDSSITPYISWQAHKGIPGGPGGEDFLDSKPYPFRYSFGSGSLLEIPITILPTLFPLNRNEKLARYYFRNVDKSIFLRFFRKMFFSNQPLWLRPHPSMNMHLFDMLINEAEKIKLPYIVMMFHSSELMPGCSKYRPDRDSVEKLYELLKGFFNKLQVKRIDSVTLTEAATTGSL